MLDQLLVALRPSKCDQKGAQRSCKKRGGEADSLPYTKTLRDARTKPAVSFHRLLEAAAADGHRSSLTVQQELIALAKHFVLVYPAC